ncbi:trace amine-associated receptor 1-like [Polyodon spathula]|uniref:trace amine-associated receptor 1-like n=1 Tax=Polyodon spathula TaxID=7913 RepID=UPI001B7ECE9F|nr:trace amine-associated receptor 1-like [Polyodon spathula]
MNFSQSGISGSTQFCYESTPGSCPKITFPIIARVPLYLFLGAVITVTLCGNLLVIISIAHFKQLHTPTHFLLLSLAAADFLVGGFVMPPSMIRSVENCWYFGDLFCKVHTSTDITLCIASLWHMFFVSIDRYYAVCHPLRYRNKITIFVTVNMIFISWTLAAVSGFGLIFLELNKQASAFITTLLFFYIPGFLMICIYLKISLVARRQARSIRDTELQRGKFSSSEHLREASFSKAVDPEEFQSVDEQMTSFMGHLSIKYYIPKKPKPWGLKVWWDSGCFEKD